MLSGRLAGQLPCGSSAAAHRRPAATFHLPARTQTCRCVSMHILHLCSRTLLSCPRHTAVGWSDSRTDLRHARTRGCDLTTVCHALQAAFAAHCCSSSGARAARQRAVLDCARLQLCVAGLPGAGPPARPPQVRPCMNPPPGHATSNSLCYADACGHGGASICWLAAHLTRRADSAWRAV